MATDIAFSLAIISLLGSRVPMSVKVFLTTLAIVDDLGAVLVIALFYTSEISLVSIAVGMACNICSFNLAEVCRTTIALMRDPETDLFETLLAPDFPGGGQLIFDRAQMERIYGTGRGSFRVRSKWGYDKSANCIDVTQIPPSTNVEVIVEKIIELAKGSKLKEVADVRDETDMTGMKITIDLKRGVDPEKLMQ